VRLASADLDVDQDRAARIQTAAEREQLGIKVPGTLDAGRQQGKVQIQKPLAADLIGLGGGKNLRFVRPKRQQRLGQLLGSRGLPRPAAAVARRPNPRH